MLRAVAAGEPDASGRLWTLIHDELRSLAARKMAGEPPGHTLQPTALVHEVYSRMLGDEPVRWDNQRHFFGAAARAMERILIDHARRKGRLKRGGAAARVPLERIDDPWGRDPTEELAVSEALDDLGDINPRAAEVVRLRYFAGLKNKLVAEVLGVSTRTVEGDWYFARAWLRRAIMRGETDIREQGAAS